ncbi:MAG: hypothetical protein ABSA57_12060 [Candidatus Acidiferrales bacterium]|jgi:hypothetical protein
MADSESPLMDDAFRPYEKLVEITILGKTFLVPERNSLLRAFQFISPETIPYGRFCWNQECQYCKVRCQLSDDDCSRPILSCKFIVSEGMDISWLAPELVGCLRAKLGAVASSSSKLRESETASVAPETDFPAQNADPVVNIPASAEAFYQEKSSNLKP